MSALLQPENDHKRFSVEQFFRLGQDGYLNDEKRHELIDGVIFEMEPPGPGHYGNSHDFYSRLSDAVGANLLARLEGPILLDDLSALVPDIALVSARSEDPHFKRSHPAAAEVLMIVEVCDSSYLKDRNVKLPKYAASSVPIVWLINLGKKHIEWFSEPDPRKGAYKRTGIHKLGSIIDIPTPVGCKIDLSDIDF